jgi:hypothetical protein
LLTLLSRSRRARSYNFLRLGVVARATQVLLAHLVQHGDLSIYDSGTIRAELEKIEDSFSFTGRLHSFFASCIKSMTLVVPRDTLLPCSRDAAKCASALSATFELATHLSLKWLCDAVFLVHVAEPSLVDGLDDPPVRSTPTHNPNRTEPHRTAPHRTSLER